MPFGRPLVQVNCTATGLIVLKGFYGSVTTYRLNMGLAPLYVNWCRNSCGDATLPASRPAVIYFSGLSSGKM